jgi:dienelactone hydrolase
MNKPIFLMIAVVGLLGGATARGVAIWDGEAGDGFWTNPVNWSANTLPVSGDSILITNGNSVILPNGNLPNACTVVVGGASTLNASAGAVRLIGSTINVTSGTLAGAWWDMGGGKLFFEAGATATMGTLEHKGANTFRFTLSETGFPTLKPGAIRGAAGTLWSNVTFIIDASAYNVSNGATVVLMDYTVAGDATHTNVFNPTITIITNASGPSASLSYDKTTLQLLLTFDAPPPAPKTWDGGGGDNSWTTPANWNPDGTPIAGDKVLVGTGASVTNGRNAFTSLMIDPGAAVKFAVDTAGGNVITNAGILNFPGTWRLFGSPVITLTGSGSFGSEIGWIDTQGARLNFLDGASVANGNMAIELRNGTKFGFTLSNSGFTTLDFGQIWDGGTTWPNITFFLDLSSYNWSNGTTVVLADFNSHTTPLGGVFNPTVNITATNGLGGVLSFDTVNSSLVLTLDPPGNDAPVAKDQTVPVVSNLTTNIVLTATDVEGSNLTFTVLSQPTNGVLTGTAPNLSYTPTNLPFLLDAFSFTASDGVSGSNTGTVKLAFIPNTAAELWATYHLAILSDPLNTEWLTNWVENGISLWQIRYDLGPLTGSRTNASPKIAAFYGYPVGGTNLPGLVQIHGGGQRAQISEAKYWAQQGYAAISINWGAGSLLTNQPNTDWDGLPGGHAHPGTFFKATPAPYSSEDFNTLYDVGHPLNSSWLLNAYAARRAMTFLQALPIVNGNKLGVTGHSMGGQNTVLTATDPRVTCIAPSVGGSGFDSISGISDPGLYVRTVDAQSYWPDITCPSLFLEAANDFNAPFDNLTKVMSLQDTNVPQIIAFVPHYNHRFDTASFASLVLWQKAWLTDGFDFPPRSKTELDFTGSDGIPRLKVWPDNSTSNAIVGVDFFYGIMTGSLTRFWRNAPGIETNGYWEAPCPIYDLNEMFVALAVVTYDIGFDLAMPVGYTSPTRTFKVASEVSTVYPPDLANNGVQETEVKERLIDDFARGFRDWYSIGSFEYWTRKLGDPSWRGPAGGNLAMDVFTTAAGNWLGVQLNTKQWNGTDATTYSATVLLPVSGVNSIALPVSAFTNGLGDALTTWEEVNQLGLMAGNRINASLPAWSGATPSFSNLNWSGGNYLAGEEFKQWGAIYGLRGNDAAPGLDVESDGSDNLFEYAIGSSPVASDSNTLQPWMRISPSAEFQGMEYVYRRRRDAAARGLTYAVQATTNLIGDTWNTNGISETGVGNLDAEFENVTNRISGGEAAYGRLKVTINE